VSLGRTLCLVATVAGLAAASTTGVSVASADGPLVRAAQWAGEPWYCKPKTYTGYGESNSHLRPTWGQGGGRTYKIRLEAKAVRCGDRTRVEFRPYINTGGFPGDRYVDYRLASAGRHKKWRAACVRLSGGRRSCRFRLTGDKRTPVPGTRPVFQFRGKGVIRYVKMFH